MGGKKDKEKDNDHKKRGSYFITALAFIQTLYKERSIETFFIKLKRFYSVV